MFWSKLVSLCNQNKTSPTAVCVELGFSNALAVKWKRGAVPRDTTLQKIADYFGVPVSYFFEEKNTDATDELTEYLEILKKRPEMKKLFSVVKNATKEDIKKTIAIIEALKNTNNG